MTGWQAAGLVLLAVAAVVGIAAVVSVPPPGSPRSELPARLLAVSVACVLAGAASFLVALWH